MRSSPRAAARPRRSAGGGTLEGMRWERAAVALAASAGGFYWLVLRRRVLTWGASVEEAAAALPGDALLAQAHGIATRAIEIHAPASAIWPWIAQMGPAPRGGAYTYDWIENVLGLRMHSADRVL